MVVGFSRKVTVRGKSYFDDMQQWKYMVRVMYRRIPGSTPSVAAAASSLVRGGLAQ